MEFKGILKKIIDVAKSDKKTIAIPESSDLRILKAVETVTNYDIAKIVLIGNKEKILKKCSENNIVLKEDRVIFKDPKQDDKKEEYANALYELRKEKGMTKEKANELILDNVYFATMLVKLDKVDGMVSGAIHSTSDTLRPALQIIKAREGVKTVSSFFLVESCDKTLGYNGNFIFSDCGLIEFPTEEQMVDIAISSTESFKLLIGDIPKVAFLSYSTKGSAKNEAIDKIVNVVEKLKTKNVDFEFDGELQLDAAIIPEVAKLKAPKSTVAGYANVLIFPNLEAGNIGYKMAQRFGGALAFGPITQGLNKPINDLSRGCSVEDIIGTIGITCVQSQNNK